ncbi:MULTISPECIES: hypothetical protein [unclassified Paenibacillus]|uniref:hypothetical protein n=1 Tax=unclassified Paenibacillus TaxID=185978 RepID=UPI002783077F|nr:MULTISPECIES: hypothetical protein [unclassified Paenibacillus]MDQ0896240.1 hypothetical protein [Paenibacillus sp. V4I7]MDQ0913832.1 hypothetical protein [Paenibacillus sp. V4I5]
MMGIIENIKLSCRCCGRAQSQIVDVKASVKVQCPECGQTEESFLPLSSFDKVEGHPIYRVFEARLKDEGTMIKFCCSNVRQPSLVEDIRSGRFLIDPDTAVCIFETFDRNEARSMATEF